MSIKRFAGVFTGYKNKILCNFLRNYAILSRITDKIEKNAKK
ncbi:hypothetical protein ELI_3025 [Eubacterium callanderi]|uniref:Uncharacterized protein n=1 Tax=Eubacterium callanderi TaxID=53442 RepID=E3GEY5_9FIRM|nr:hypothetical protein ELI_3025 [Eubacterium callanderi]